MLYEGHDKSGVVLLTTFLLPKLCIVRGGNFALDNHLEFTDREETSMAGNKQQTDQDEKGHR